VKNPLPFQPPLPHTLREIYAEALTSIEHELREAQTSVRADDSSPDGPGTRGHSRTTTSSWVCPPSGPPAPWTRAHD
jgi:hypothetical protein